MTTETKTKEPIFTCDFCGYTGTGREIAEEDYRDSLGHDTVRYGCRDKTACLDRMVDQGRLPIYYKRVDTIRA